MAGAATHGSARTVLLLVVPVLWIGILLGVSFLATPAKFLAPSLSLPVALDVGRQTFAVLSRVEWGLALVVLMLLPGLRKPAALAGAGVAIAVVMVETLWLLPVLDDRVGQIIAGGQPPASKLHAIYIGLEIAKLFALSVIGFEMGRRLLRAGGEAPARPSSRLGQSGVPARR